MKARRVILGVTAAIMLAAAVLIYLSRGYTDTSAYLISVLARVGIVLFTIFLAWPALEKHADRLPAIVSGTLLAGLLLAAIRPNMFRFIGLLVIAILVIHFGFRLLSKHLKN